MTAQFAAQPNLKVAPCIQLALHDCTYHWPLPTKHATHCMQGFARTKDGGVARTVPLVDQWLVVADPQGAILATEGQPPRGGAAVHAPQRTCARMQGCTSPPAAAAHGGSGRPRSGWHMPKRAWQLPHAVSRSNRCRTRHTW